MIDTYLLHSLVTGRFTDMKFGETGSLSWDLIRVPFALKEFEL